MAQRGRPLALSLLVSISLLLTVSGTTGANEGVGNITGMWARPGQVGADVTIMWCGDTAQSATVTLQGPAGYSQLLYSGGRRDPAYSGFIAVAGAGNYSIVLTHWCAGVDGWPDSNYGPTTAASIYVPAPAAATPEPTAQPAPVAPPPPPPAATAAPATPAPTTPPRAPDFTQTTPRLGAIVPAAPAATAPAEATVEDDGSGGDVVDCGTPAECAALTGSGAADDSIYGPDWTISYREPRGLAPQHLDLDRDVANAVVAEESDSPATVPAANEENSGVGLAVLVGAIAGVVVGLALLALLLVLWRRKRSNGN